MGAPVYRKLLALRMKAIGASVTGSLMDLLKSVLFWLFSVLVA